MPFAYRACRAVLCEARFEAEGRPVAGRAGSRRENSGRTSDTAKEQLEMRLTARAVPTRVRIRCNMACPVIEPFPNAGALKIARQGAAWSHSRPLHNYERHCFGVAQRLAVQSWKDHFKALRDMFCIHLETWHRMLAALSIAPWRSSYDGTCQRLWNALLPHLGNTMRRAEATAGASDKSIAVGLRAFDALNLLHNRSQHNQQASNPR